jgi:hypothetical protein
MPDTVAPWQTCLTLPGDPGFTDDETELDRLVERQVLIEQILTAEVRHFDVLTDMLCDHGFDVTEYVEQVEWNVDAIIHREDVPEDVRFYKDV